MFRFIVKHLGFLKQVPLLPHLFDSQLKLWVLLTNRQLLDCFDDIENEVLSWDGTGLSVHKFGGLQFNCNDKEIGHVHSNGILDIRFSRITKQQLIAEGKVTDHHVFGNSGWISFYIRKREDVAYAVKLLKMSLLKINSKPRPVRFPS